MKSRPGQCIIDDAVYAGQDINCKNNKHQLSERLASLAASWGTNLGPPMYDSAL